ncbi:MAG: sugar ABC transporter permease [Actinobacteria bacterium]|nr:sugar ABC transporter permease [Actinomycetota bacterium]
MMVGYLFISPFVFFILAINIGPVVYSFIKSFFSYSLVGANHFVGFDIYKGVFTDPIFWNSLKNTGLFAIISIPIEITIALFVAVLFSYNINSKFKTIFKAIYFLPIITSFVASGFVFRWAYDTMHGPLDQILVNMGLPKIMFLTNMHTVIPSIAVVHIWMRIGFAMIIFLAGLEGIPRIYYEAAMIDGASRWKMFCKITLPLLNPQIVMVVIIETLVVLKIFDLPYVLTSGGPAGRSTPIVFHIYETIFTYGRAEYAMAMSIILIVIIMIINVVQWIAIKRKVEY